MHVHGPSAQSRMLDQIGHFANLAIGNLCGVQGLLQGGPTLLPHALAHQTIDQSAVGHPQGVGGHALVLRRLGCTQYLGAKLGPLAVVLNADDHPHAIVADESTIRCNRRMGQPCRSRRSGTVPLVHIGHGHPVGGTVKQRHRNRAAQSRALAQQQRIENCAVGVHARPDVAHRHPNAPGCARAAAHADQTRLALHQQIVGFQLAGGMARAITADVTGDQARITLAQIFAAKASSGQGAGGQVLHKYIGFGQQAVQQFGIGGLFVVQYQRLFAPIGPDKIRSLARSGVVVATGKVALRALNFDDPRPCIGQAAGGQGGGHGLFDTDHQDASEWQVGGNGRAGGMCCRHGLIFPRVEDFDQCPFSS